MLSIPENRILKYKPDTLDYLRNQYGFDTPKRINDAIDSLEDWAAKQEHFTKKSFDREYLERLLIYNKGSVEKCKKKLDKLCTFRTFIPDFFVIGKVDRDLFLRFHFDGLLSQMTPDYGRVHFMRLQEKIDSNIFVNYCKYFVLIHKYVQVKDYCNHLTIIVDWTDANVLEFIRAADISELRKSCEIAFEGFSMRLKAMHMVTSSKAIDAFLSILKPILGTKLSSRIKIHNTMDTVYEYVPKYILPQEYGGNDKPLSQLRDDLYNELFSAEFTEYRLEMNKAYTNEALRQKDKFNEDYMGISGTFRTLSVD